MKYKFTAGFNIEGKPITHRMEYDSVDIVKTLERRLKTAFPNATGIQITLDPDKLPDAPPFPELHKTPDTQHVEDAPKPKARA